MPTLATLATVRARNEWAGFGTGERSTRGQGTRGSVPEEPGGRNLNVALTVPRTEQEPGLSGAVWGTRAAFLRSGGLVVVRLGVDYDEPRKFIDAWREKLRKAGGLVVALVPSVGPHIAVDAMTLGQVDVANEQGKPVFTDVPPDDWGLPDHGMAVTGTDAEHILGAANVTVFGNDVSIIREGLR